MFSRKPAAMASVVLAALALAATLLTGGPASAAPSGSAHASAVKVDTAASKPAKSVRVEFAAQARTAGLTDGQARALQGKVDAYLTKLGAKATQADFNTIALKGADLHVTVPGEAHPRGLAAAYCSYKYFCAYEGEWQSGDAFNMYTCGNRWYIPWFTTGSWVNNQTPGTRPVLTFTNGSTWVMPAAYADQLTGVGWSPVWYIVPC